MCSAPEALLFDFEGILLTNHVVCVIILFVREKLAQLAEHLPFKERVEGSNPSFLIQKRVSQRRHLFCFTRKAASPKMKNLHKPLDKSLGTCYNL